MFHQTMFMKLTIKVVAFFLGHPVLEQNGNFFGRICKMMCKLVLLKCILSSFNAWPQSKHKRLLFKIYFSIFERGIYISPVARHLYSFTRAQKIVPIQKKIFKEHYHCKHCDLWNHTFRRNLCFISDEWGILYFLCFQFKQTEL